MFCLMCSIFLIGLINAAHGENNNRKLRLGVKLTDGSYVIGTLDVSSLPVRTDEAKTDVELSNIRTIKFADGVKSVVIRLQNGDQITGELMLKRIDLTTIFGKVKIEKVSEGKQLQLAELGSGDVFGEMSLIDAIPTSATVTVLKASKLLLGEATIEVDRETERLLRGLGYFGD